LSNYLNNQLYLKLALVDKMNFNKQKQHLKMNKLISFIAIILVSFRLIAQTTPDAVVNNALCVGCSVKLCIL
jgi:UDP-N-acetylglucosamine:LPS N-acetylglucosamine transferase